MSPLPMPILDDRSYEQLRDELIRRIPVYAEEWSDHNPSDPGITLIELFAYLGESLLYRFNQIPETARLEFLRLLQIPLRPARPSRALLELSADKLEGALVEKGTEAKAGDLLFETRTEVRALPVSALAVCKAATSAPGEDEPEVLDFFQRSIDAIDGLESSEEAASYQNQIVTPQGGGLPVDFGLAVDGILWVAVLAESDAGPDGLRQAIAKHDEAPIHLNLGFVPDSEAPPAEEIEPCPGEGAEDGGPPVEWEISTGRFAGAGREPLYRALQLGGDTTRGLTEEGVVRLRMPDSLDDVGVFELDDPDAGGTRDLPPRMDDETEAKILFWLRAYRRDAEDFGKILYIGANVAQVIQSRRARTEFLGVGDGQANQSYKLIHSPVLEGTLALEVEEADGWQLWEQVDGFHASGESDRHYLLDLESGEVRFGNGLQGYPPRIGQRIRAREYRYGGGSQGNVAADAISKLSPAKPDLSGVKASNPLPARGGADAESIAQALDRIPGELRRRDRAVTRGDFRELALMTPGVDVARAESLPLFHPHSRNEEAAGVVTVVVWPQRDARHPRAPRPDRRVLRCVCRWLDARRLVTTELYVIPPRYRKVAVAVGLRVKPDYGIEAVRRWVELVLRQYLAPLPPHGPSGEGWPLGRRVHGPELEAAALQVEGVEFLEGLDVAGWNEEAESWEPGTVELELDEAVELTEMTVVEGPPAEPGEALSPLEPEKTPVPIPIIREEC